MGNQSSCRKLVAGLVCAAAIPFARAASPPPPVDVHAIAQSCNQTDVFFGVPKTVTMQFGEVDWATTANFADPCGVLISTSLFLRPTPPSDAVNNYYYFRVGGDLTQNFPDDCKLQPCESWYFRAVVAQAIGFTGPSAPVVANNNTAVLMSVDPLPPFVVSVSPRLDSCETSICFAFADNYNDCQNGNCTIFYSTEPDMSNEIATLLPFQQQTGDIGPLIAGQTYYFQILCSNSCNVTGNRTAIDSFVFPGPNAPGNLTAEQLYNGDPDNPDVDSVLVAWQVPSNITSPVATCNLTISAAPDLSNPTFIAPDTTPASSYGLVVDLPVPSTRYFQVTCASTCGGLLSAPSEIFALDLGPLPGPSPICTQTFVD